MDKIDGIGWEILGIYLLNHFFFKFQCFLTASPHFCFTSEKTWGDNEYSCPTLTDNENAAQVFLLTMMFTIGFWYILVFKL